MQARRFSSPEAELGRGGGRSEEEGPGGKPQVLEDGLGGRGAKDELLRLKGKGRTLTTSDEELKAQLVAALVSARLGPPTVNELAAQLSTTRGRVLELLKIGQGEGRVVKVAEDLYFDRAALDALRDRLVAHLQEHKEISSQAFKEMVGQTRKLVIHLSEYFDRERVTLGIGEKRVLRRASGRRVRPLRTPKQS